MRMFHLYGFVSICMLLSGYVGDMSIFPRVLHYWDLWKESDMSYIWYIDGYTPYKGREGDIRGNVT